MSNLFDKAFDYYSSNNPCKIIFYPVTDGLPEKSGDYIVITEAGCLKTLPFSSEYSAFNRYDNERDPSDEYNIDVLFWAEIPDFVLWCNEKIDNYIGKCFKGGDFND